MDRRVFPWWLLCLFGILVISLVFCSRIPESVQPPMPTGSVAGSTMPKSVTSTPRILSMTIDGIPKEDITINETTSEILVKMPPTVTNAILKPTLTLTPNAELAVNGVYMPASWCSCCWPTADENRFGLRTNSDVSQELKYYTVRPVATGELAPVPLSAPFEYAIDNEDPLPIPFIHLYGNELPTSVVLTKNGSSQAITLLAKDRKISCGYQLNNLSLDLYGQPLTVGNYTVTFYWANGRTMNLSQPLQVRKGISRLAWVSRWYGFRVVAGTELTLEGNFLLKDEIRLQLKSLTGQIIPIRVTDFQIDGKRVKLVIPTDVTPGVYVLQLFQDDQLVECHKLTVLSDTKWKLAISTITMDYISPLSVCSLNEPVVITRPNRTAIFYTTPSTPALITHVQLQLTNVTNAQEVFTVPIAQIHIESAYYFTVPATATPGHYTAILQLVNTQTGQILESSKPFEQLVDVR